MKKIVMCDFAEYHSKANKLANYHYCNCFANDGYEVLWMSNAFNHLNALKNKEAFQYKLSISSVKRHLLAENVYGFAPYSLWLYANYPLFRSAKILKHFERLIIPNINESLKKLDFADVDILWISTPKAYFLTNVINYKKLVYRIADDYKQFKELPNIEEIHNRLIERADHVIISSSTLEQNVREQGKTPLLLSNGVMFKHFNKSDVECPKEYSNRKRKRMVYIGAIKYWFDTKLVEKIAEQVDADIFLIGDCDYDLSALRKYDHVYILGPRSYDVLPGYLRYADVAIIPFIRNNITDSISPIKLFEYCAAGLAVVTTYMTETAKLNAPVWLADNHDAFIFGIKTYLEQGYDRSRLVEYARLNSWEHRYALLKETVLE